MPYPCGRCGRECGSSETAWVTNAPKGMNDSWCHQCIEAVNKGAPVIVPGKSLDKEGNLLQVGLDSLPKKTGIPSSAAIVGLLTWVLAFIAAAAVCEIGLGLHEGSTGKGVVLLLVPTVLTVVAVWLVSALQKRRGGQE